MKENLNNTKALPLSANSFIKALRGETINDDNGNEINFIEEISFPKITGFDNVKWIKIKNVLVNEEIIIDEDKEFPYPIDFVSGNFNHFTVSHGNFKNQFRISGGEFQHGLKINNGNFYSLEFEGGYFKDWTIISGGEFEKIQISRSIRFKSIPVFDNFLGISGSVSVKELSIYDANCKWFKISGGKFENASFNGGKFESFTISGGVFEKDITFKGGQIDTIYISPKHKDNDLPTSVEYIELPGLKFDLKISGQLIIDSVKLERLTFSKGLSTTGSINLKYIKLNELNFKNFHNAGRVNISNIIPSAADSKFTINGCDLGNTSFKYVDFTSFKELFFLDSQLAEIKTTFYHIPTRKRWPNQKFLKESTIESLMALYKDLVKAKKNDGEPFEADKYYREYLDLYRKIKIQVFKKNRQDIYTPLSLWFRKFASNYGTNWLKAASLILIYGAILYIFYFASLHGISSMKNLNSQNIDYFFQYYLQFLLPTHELQLIPNTKLSTWSIVFDVIGRIGISFFIYETINAFRRFDK